MGRSDSDADQVALALSEIALCIAQGLHEIDPEAGTRMNYAAGKAYNRLKAGGDEKAAELVYMFGRALMDRTAFPKPDE